MTGAGPPRISVVVPCFDGAAFLGEALRSALEQDPPPDEVLVQDGGSRDGSAAVAASFGDDRIRFVSEPDRGQSDALNRGIARATGEWIVWLNADDVLYPGLTACTAPDADFVYGDFDYVDERGAVVRRFRPGPELSARRLLTEGCYLFSGAALFRRSLFEDGGLDLGLRYAMDYDLYLRVAARARSRYVPRPLGAFRVHGDSKTSGLTWPIFRETVVVRRRHGGYGPQTRRPVLVNQAKQLVDLATLPARRRLGWR